MSRYFRVQIFTVFSRILLPLTPPVQSALLDLPCGFARSRSLFSTAYFSPTLFSRALSFRRRCMYIWANPARCARHRGSTTRARLFLGIYSVLPPRSGRRHGLSFVGRDVATTVISLHVIEGTPRKHGEPG
ncbi:hypothetical protein K438DRAFT_1848349 [Mycena galopus ATCC 62051]|nr:hypothetical protein K438DRAFT_1848349 [Mycena galopus ATCC 62051]